MSSLARTIRLVLVAVLAAPILWASPAAALTLHHAGFGSSGHGWNGADTKSVLESALRQNPNKQFDVLEHVFSVLDSGRFGHHGPDGEDHQDFGRRSHEGFSPAGGGYHSGEYCRPVPEPASLLLLGSGLAALAIRRRRTA